MKLDWKAYFKEFCSTHGGTWVVYGADKETGKGGVLLFEDGWSYDRKNRLGPEYPPPNNTKHHLGLIKCYWSIRCDDAISKYATAKQNLHELLRLQQQRSAPVQVIEAVQVMSDEEGNELTSPKMRRVSTEVDFRLLIDNLRELKTDVCYCQNHLEHVTIPKQGKTLFNPASILSEVTKIDGQVSIDQKERTT